MCNLQQLYLYKSHLPAACFTGANLSHSTNSAASNVCLCFVVVQVVPGGLTPAGLDSLSASGLRSKSTAAVSVRFRATCYQSAPNTHVLLLLIIMMMMMMAIALLLMLQVVPGEVTEAGLDSLSASGLMSNLQQLSLYNSEMPATNPHATHMFCCW
jgi:hypothetical protein